ncbi:MAG: tetratricopeptide repeat protein [Calditrichaeota bacterium]|nr:MAG: tetratricopeptide repeat protein [Calditrichota bacterium]
MEVGQPFLHYRIRGKLGEGGMGTVYRAEDTRLQRPVAIKCLTLQLKNRAVERKRFLVEARAAAALNHPNITTVYAVEELDGELFIVMEYVEGEDLSRLIASQGRLEPGRVRAIGLEVGAGLLAAHQSGVLHRDVKSSNIMLTEAGNAKIMDFGLARRTVDPHLTTPGATVGTIHYMSPEQVRGETVDARSDQWAFGVVLYECYNGRLPFDGAYPPAIMYAIVNEDMQAFSASAGNGTSNLVPVIKRCLQKDPEKRYPSMAECLEALRSGQRSASVTIPVSVQFKTLTQKAAGALRSPVVLGSLVVALLLSLALVTFFFTRPPGTDAVAVAGGAQQLVILPIENIGGDRAQQALCRGLVESLTSSVGQMNKFYGSLWVVPASEVRKNKVSSPSEGLHQFKANLAVTGSLQKLPDLYRLSLNLIDAVHLRQISATVMDIRADQISALQSRAVEWLLQALSLKVNPEARTALEDQASREPGAFEFYLQGKGYLSYPLTLQTAEAPITLFKKAIQSDSAYALAYAGLAEAYWRKYILDQDPRWPLLATEAALKAISLDSSSAPIRVSVGNMYLGTGRYAQAEKAFRTALAIDPNDPEAYLGVAQALERSDRLEQAERYYYKVIELKPEYWGYYNSLGKFYFRTGQLHKAARQFKRVVELSPDNLKGYMNLGAVYYRLEDWEKAESILEHALTIGTDYGVMNNLGSVYFIQGKYEKAYEIYEKVASLRPLEHSAWGNMGSASLWIPGRESQVVPLYRKAIERAEIARTINPNDPELLIWLAQYYSMVGDTARSLNLARQGLSISPENVMVLYGAAAAYEKLGYRKEALKYMGQVMARGYGASEIRKQPEFRALVADPRFDEVVARVAAGKKAK